MNRCVISIAGNTARDVVRQGLFFLIAAGGIALILCSFSFTLFAFGEESRMIQEMGISTIVICCLCLASLSAANTLSREVEKGTMMMLLSKPVVRSSVVLGKFFGILGAVSLLFTTMGVILTTALCVRESLDHHTGFLSSFTQIGSSTVFQLVFSFVPVAIMCAVATAGSVWLGMIPNLCCCIVIYIVGNLASSFQAMFPSTIIWSSWYLIPIFAFFPNLEEFSAIGMGGKSEAVDFCYVTALLIYAVLYIVFVITLTIKFFDRKECR